MSEKYHLVIHFVDESGSFVHGFECGQMWERMKSGALIEYAPVHLANQEQLKLMCGYYGYDCSFTEIDDEWIGFKASPIDITSLQI